MLEITTQKKILELTGDYWGKHVRESTFTHLVSGKEPGHRMADFVDDKTVSLFENRV